MNLLSVCLAYLDQASRLVTRLSPEQYAQIHPQCFNSSIGQHIRHCLDHFAILLDDLDSARIDYDRRRREGALEQRPQMALETIQYLQQALIRVVGNISLEQSVSVRLDCGESQPQAHSSSLGRELQFLLSHTLHHFAIIGIMCREIEVPLDPDFGMAPSTLRHRNRLNRVDEYCGHDE